MAGKLPIITTLLTALNLFREHASYAFKITAPWFLLFSIAHYFLARYSGIAPTLPNDNSVWIGGLLLIGSLLLITLYVVGLSSIAVLWHWRILSGNRQSKKMVTFDRRIWFYILRLILIVVVAVGGTGLVSISLVSIASILPFISIDYISWDVFEIYFSVSVVVIASISIVVSLIAARLSVSLPAIALNVQEFGLGKAWDMTTGNSIRLLLVTSLPLLPLILLSSDLDFISAEWRGVDEGSPFWICAQLLYGLAEFAFWLLYLTVLSLTYAFFSESESSSTVSESRPLRSGSSNRRRRRQLQPE